MNKQNLQKLALAVTLALSTTAQADQLQIQKDNDDFFNQLDQIVQSVTPRKNSRWGVSKLSLNTSKTHDGILGLMPFKGTATSTLSWIPKNASAKSTTATDIKSFSLRTDDGQLVATTWYREFFRAKKLPWSSNNELEFLSLFKQAREIAQEIANVDHPSWSIDQFVVERGIGLKGNLAPLVSAEAKFAIRFAFDLKSAKRTGMKANSELTNLVLGLAEDLSTSGNSFSLPSWKVDGFNLGLGISPILGIGVVNAKPFAFAYMTFKAKANRTIASASLRQQIKNVTSKNIKLLDYSSVTQMSMMGSQEKAVIINREKFRKGLAAALKMAGQMTAKADKADSDQKSWRLGQVVYRYDMGVSGDLTFVALKGKISAEVSLKKDLNRSSAMPNQVAQASSVNTDLKQALATELQDNYQVLSQAPQSQTLSGIESIAFLKLNWGLDTSIVDLKVSAVPQVRLKFANSGN